MTPKRVETPLELYIQEIIGKSLTDSQREIIRALVRCDRER